MMVVQIFTFVKLACPQYIHGKMGVKKLYLRSLRYKAIYFWGAVVFGIFLLYVCTRPHSMMERWHYPDISDLFDAANHFIGFTLFNFLVLSVLQSLLHKRAAVALLAVGVSWGLVCELLQLFIPSRSFQLMDVGANTLPSFLVFCIFKMKKKSMYDKV
jgi:VanZ family protein